MTKNIFSESRGVVDDGIQNAADVEQLRYGGVHEDVRENLVRGGVMTTSDCPYCGIQWRGIIKWPEVVGFFFGQQVPNTVTSPRGVAMAIGCKKCGRISPMLLSWSDVDRYIVHGVKTGALPADIYKAKAEFQKKQQQQKR